MEKKEPITTKDKILAAALELFNQNGVEAVTVRHIAKTLGISHGNLCYHFPRKEDIIFTLYNRVVEFMSADVADWDPENITLSTILESIGKAYKLQYAYKFLMVDFVNIMRRIPDIREHFRQIFELRKSQFGFALEHLKSKGLLRRDIPDEQYGKLILHSYLLGDFWMSESEILYAGNEADKPLFYADVACALLFPYLTGKGRREYERFQREIASETFTQDK